MLDNANVFLIGAEEKMRYIGLPKNEIVQNALVDFIGTGDYPIMVIELTKFVNYANIVSFLHSNDCTTYPLEVPNGLVLFAQYDREQMADENLVEMTKEYFETFKRNDEEEKQQTITMEKKNG